MPGEAADAVDALATGSGRVRDRLFEASTYLTRVRPEDIPDEDVRRTFIGVMEDDLSYAQPQGDEGRILATLRITNDKEARCGPAPYWSWTLAYSFHEGRALTRGHEATVDAAMQAFSRSWHREA